jgi:hypothetical protein
MHGNLYSGHHNGDILIWDKDGESYIVDECESGVYTLLHGKDGNLYSGHVLNIGIREPLNLDYF